MKNPAQWALPLRIFAAVIMASFLVVGILIAFSPFLRELLGTLQAYSLSSVRAIILVVFTFLGVCFSLPTYVCGVLCKRVK